MYKLMKGHPQETRTFLEIGLDSLVKNEMKGGRVGLQIVKL